MILIHLLRGHFRLSSQVLCSKPAGSSVVDSLLKVNSQTSGYIVTATNPKSFHHSSSGFIGIMSSKTDEQPSKKPKLGAWADKDTGEYKRQVSSFRDWVKADGSADFKPEKNRYRLYIANACPWCNRVMIMRALKGLEDVIPVTLCYPLMTTKSWAFAGAPDYENDPSCKPDPVKGFKYAREIYEAADPNYSARYTLPVLWDTKKNTIVNNESSEICRMLNSEFNALAKNPKLDTYPAKLQKKIDEVSQMIYDGINNGVYKVGFATKQDAYDKNLKALFECMDKVEKMLEKKKFLVGDTFTESDYRLFVTTVRFDPVYITHFKCNLKRLTDYPNILAHLKRVYNMPGVKETIHMRHIKEHYFMSHTNINPNQIVGAYDGPDLSE
eukprot:Nk52_evm18s355 gene=Nk52_evmTU18s355